MSCVRYLNLKKSYLVTWLSSSSKCAVVYQILSKSGWFFVEIYGDSTVCKVYNMAAVRHVECLKFRVYFTWPLLPYARFHSYQSIHSWSRYNYFRFGKTNLRHIGILLPLSISTVPHYSATHFALEFHPNRTTFSIIMMLYRFSRWQTLRRNFTSGFGSADVHLLEGQCLPAN